MSDMDKMQADAVSRAREMYSRRSPPYSANGFPSGYNGNMKTNTNVTAERNAHFGDTSSKAPQKHEDPKTDSEKDSSQFVGEEQNIADTFEREEIPQGQSGDFLDNILADKEKALIILLIALLNEEKASSSLLLALMYLII